MRGMERVRVTESSVQRKDVKRGGRRLRLLILEVAQRLAKFKQEEPFMVPIATHKGSIIYSFHHCALYRASSNCQLH